MKLWGNLAVWDSVETFDPTPLPPGFMLKANHGSGFNFGVTDKTLVDWAGQRKELARWMSSSYETAAWEPQYRSIPRRLFAEELLSFDPAHFSDVKFFVASGEILAVFAIRYRPIRECQYLDADWRRLPLSRTDVPLFEGEIPRPRYFGELTFTPTGGFLNMRPDETDSLWGAKVALEPYRFPEDWRSGDPGR